MNKDLFREIMKFAVEKAREITDKQKALEVKYLYKEFEKQIGKVLTVGEYIQYDDKLYEVIQGHTAQADWTPDISKSLFVIIDKEHLGTIDDPIPAQENMIYYNGKYYIENEILYLCIRNSEIALQFLPSALVGNYFELVNNGEVDEPTENEPDVIPPTENEGGEDVIPPTENEGGEDVIPPTENEGGEDEPTENEPDVIPPTENEGGEDVIPPTENEGGEDVIPPTENEGGEVENDVIVIENYTVGVNYEEGKYYAVNGVVYLCTRSGLLYHDPATLIGHYFELAV